MTTAKWFSGACALVALVALGTVGLAQQGGKAKPRDQSHGPHSEAMGQCARSCSDCQRECDSCATHCAQELRGGNAEHFDTLQSCLDCSTVCAAASQIAARGGPFAGLICQSCAEACDRCAERCEKFDGDDHMRRCAAECRKCAKACRDMLEHHPQK